MLKGCFHENCEISHSAEKHPPGNAFSYFKMSKTAKGTPLGKMKQFRRKVAQCRKHPNEASATLLVEAEQIEQKMEPSV